MTGLLRRLLPGRTLSDVSSGHLLGRKRAARTGLPPDGIAGDRSGTGERGAANDAAIACYVDAPGALPGARDAAQGEAGRIVARRFA